jgi:hypothetical protein
MAMSAFLSLQGTPPKNEMPAQLQAKGWVTASPPPCSGLTQGFYELESDSENREFYMGDPENVLSASDRPWPEPPVYCHPIPHPTFIEEIP